MTRTSDHCPVCGAAWTVVPHAQGILYTCDESERHREIMQPDVEAVLMGIYAKQTAERLSEAARQADPHVAEILWIRGTEVPNA